MRPTAFRTVVAVVLISASPTTTSAQTFLIPDAAFAAQLENYVPAAITGNVLDTTHPEVLALTDMAVSNLGISDLDGIQFFTALQNLTCSNNQLTELPTLPASLIQLSCPYNQLTTLPTLPPDLFLLMCGYNQITSLPELPNELEWFHCEYNLLTTLPNVPDSAVFMRFDHNLIDTLPSMANSAMHILMCYDNLLEELPELPPTLGQFWCNNNPIECLPPLPNSLYNLNCTNTMLTCMPNIPVSFDTASFWADFTAQVCDVTTSACEIREEIISGNVFEDLDGDSDRDPGEPPFLLANVEAQPGDFLTAPDPGGNYVLHVDTGTYVLQGQSVLYHLITTPPVTTTLSIFEADALRDIGYQIIPGMYDVVADLIAGPARPGFFNPVTLGVQNVGTEPTTATIVFTFDPIQTWFDVDDPPVTLVGNQATWSAPLAPGELWSARVYLHTDSTVALGTIIEHVLTAAIPEPDQTPPNNTDTDPGSILGSLDPNDKNVRPEELTPDQVLAGERVEYTIRFQNTGTYAAERIVITDTLSTDLQWTTMDFHSASHPCTWYIAGGVLYVIFDPIWLPDSTADEPGSHGYVHFSMRPDDLVMSGEIVSNTANIFFDYNTPVITEPAIFTITFPVGVLTPSGSTFMIFPNPLTTMAHLAFPSPLTAQQRIDVVDLQGRVVRSLSGEGERLIPFRSSGLSSGLYSLRWMDGDTHVSSVRIVIQ